MFEPTTIKEVQEAIRSSDSVLPVGKNTKSALTRVPDSCIPISMVHLTGVIEYDPSEFTITVLAGTPLKEIQNVLSEQGQYLPFDPPLASAGASIGGTVAAGLSGPGAYRYGPIRDFLIGVSYIDSDARVITGGGKVVKNAAGFDIPKFLIGSLGRLGILVELTFKVFPEPEARSTFSIGVKDCDEATKLIAQLSRTAFDLEALDYAANQKVLRGRLAGNAEAIKRRLPKIAETVAQYESFQVLGPDEANVFWTEQLEFSWCKPDLALAKFTSTTSSIKDHDDCTIHYSIGGNVAWANAPLDRLTDGFEATGLLIRSPQDGSMWTKPRQSFKIENALKQALDKNGKFPPLRDSHHGKDAMAP